MKTTIQIHEIEAELYAIESLLKFLETYFESADENIGLECIVKELSLNLNKIFKILEDD